MSNQTTVQMTATQLDEAIAELHEPKPAGPSVPRYRIAYSKGFRWRWDSRNSCWLVRNRPTIRIEDAKVLQKELVLGGWGFSLQQHQRVAHIDSDVLLYELDEDGRSEAGGREIFCIDISEQRAISRVYYEAKTGVRVEIVEESGS